MFLLCLGVCVACDDESTVSPQDGAVDVLGDSADVSPPECAKDGDCKPSGNECAPSRCSTSGTCVFQLIDGLLCDDGDPCTFADVCKDAKCTSGADLCACRKDADCVKGDHNVCLGERYCALSSLPYSCAINSATAVQCSARDDTICVTNICDPDTGACAMTPRSEAALCDDGNPCSIESTCKAGACQGGSNLCNCTSDIDCAAKEDGDVCNGTLYCNKGALPWVCEIKPNSAINCSDKKDTACQVNTCDSISGKCAMKAASDGSVCEADGVPCTADACEGGVCVDGGKLCKCDGDADCGPMEDGNACNGVLYCDKGTSPPSCKLNPATIQYCSGSDTTCLVQACVPQTGTCLATPVESAIEHCSAGANPICRWEVAPPGAVTKTMACDDGDACTKAETCVGGVCGGGQDLCACQSDQDCQDVPNADLCAGKLYCDKVAGKCVVNAATAVVCSAGKDTDCLKNACTPATGECGPTATGLAICIQANPGGDVCLRWVQKPDNAKETSGLPCDDGQSCTVGDICKAGQCVAGTDTCKCTDNAQCAKFDDGDVCNGTMFCNKQKGTCELNPATVIKCKTVDDSACVKNTCQPKSGDCVMQAVVTGAPCEDGQACTKNDLCKDGKCQAGTLACACLTNEDCIDKDGNPCNGVPYCDKSKIDAKTKQPIHQCLPNPASVIFCPGKDDTQCLKSTCDPKTGKCSLQPVAEGKPCEDGNPCSQGTNCVKGKCLGKTLQCDDGVPCTTDICKDNACKHLPKSCDDGNSCTQDICDPKTGQCSFIAAAANGVACNGDNNGCTANDVCNKGVCNTGKQITCKLQVGICEQPSCISLSASSFKCVKVDRPDGTDCDDNKGCWLGATCKSGLCKAGDKQRLYTATVAPSDKSAAGQLNNGLILAGDHALVVGRWSKTPAGAKAPHYGWWLARLDATGAPVWQKLDPSSATDPFAAAHAVTGLGNGVAVAGASLGKNGDLDARVGWLDPNTKVMGTKTYGSPGADEVPRGVLSLATGGLVLAGHRSFKGDLNGWLLGLTAGGQAKWNLAVGGPGAQRLLAVVSDGIAGSISAGVAEAGQGGSTRGLLVRVDVTGKLLWQRFHGQAAGNGLTTLAAMPDGGYAAGGWRDQGGLRLAWLLRLDADGALSWDRATEDPLAIDGLAHVGQGRLVLAGASAPLDLAKDKGGQATGWLAGAGTIGNLHWQAKAGPTGSGLRHLHRQGTGLLAVGQTLGSGKELGLVVRSDLWGNRGCKDSEQCSGKTVASCVDNKDCTLDTCHKGTCGHIPAIGMICAGAGCVVEGLCGPAGCGAGPKSRRFTKLYDAKGLQRIDTVAAAPGGGLVLAGPRTDGTGHLLRLDRFGKVELNTTLGSTPVSRASGVVVRTDGDAVILVSHDAGPPYTTNLLHVDPTGKIKGTWQLFSGAKNNIGTAWDLVAEKDDVVMAVFRWRKFSNTHAEVHRRDIVTGKALQNYSFTFGPVYRAVGKVRARPLPDGGAIFAGEVAITLLAKFKPNGFLVRMNSKGKPIWQQEYGRGHHCQLDGVSPVDGGYMAVGRRHLTDGSHPFWFIKVDSKGNLVWQRVMADPDKSTVNGFLPGSNGDFMLIGGSDQGNGSIWLRRFGSTGLPDWKRTFKVAGGVLGVAGHRAIAPLPDGGFALAGTVSGFNVAQPMVIRAGPWGYGTCENAGICGGKTAKDCADGKLCTLDTCEPKKGCGITTPKCDDGLSCTTDSCDAIKGCTHAVKGCDDGNACTLDNCVEGKGCQHAKVVCDDGNDCTTDSCNPGKGCVAVPATDGVSCPGNACGDAKASCKSGACAIPSGAFSDCGKQANPAPSCLAVRNGVANAKSGVWWLDLDGGGPGKAIKAYCDMSRHGGGWMLLVTQTNLTHHYKNSVSPFHHDVNPDKPGIHGAYSRDWRKLITPKAGQEIMVGRGKNLPDSARLLITDWCGWESTDTAPCTGPHPTYARGCASVDDGPWLACHDSWLAGCSGTGTCAKLGCDTLGITVHQPDVAALSDFGTFLYGTGLVWGGCGWAWGNVFEPWGVGTPKTYWLR